MTCEPCDVTCTLGCYGPGKRCVKPDLKPEIKSIPEKPTAYIIEIARPIEEYNDYHELFQVLLVTKGKEQ